MWLELGGSSVNLFSQLLLADPSEFLSWSRNVKRVSSGRIKEIPCFKGFFISNWDELVGMEVIPVRWEIQTNFIH